MRYRNFPVVLETLNKCSLRFGKVRGDGLLGVLGALLVAFVCYFVGILGLHWIL